MHGTLSDEKSTDYVECFPNKSADSQMGYIGLLIAFLLLGWYCAISHVPCEIISQSLKMSTDFN
jgi:hypothetical protein